MNPPDLATGPGGFVATFLAVEQDRRTVVVADREGVLCDVDGEVAVVSWQWLIEAARHAQDAQPKATAQGARPKAHTQDAQPQTPRQQVAAGAGGRR